MTPGDCVAASGRGVAVFDKGHRRLRRGPGRLMVSLGKTLARCRAEILATTPRCIDPLGFGQDLLGDLAGAACLQRPPRADPVHEQGGPLRCYPNQERLLPACPTPAALESQG